MTFKEIRTLLVELSGRYDLVQDTVNYVSSTPVGADFFIRAGQKFLDDHSTTPDSNAIYEVALTPGTSEYLIPNARSIEKVWTEDSGDSTVKYACKEMPRLIREEYGPEPFTTIDRARPIYYAIVGGDQQAPTADRAKKKIILLPPPDQAYTLKVEGLFYAYELTNDNDVNWWSLVYPQVLVRAAMLQIEAFYRNSEGVRDHLSFIQSELQGIDFNVVSEEVANVTRMKNSW